MEPSAIEAPERGALKSVLGTRMAYRLQAWEGHVPLAKRQFRPREISPSWPPPVVDEPLGGRAGRRRTCSSTG